MADGDDGMKEILLALEDGVSDELDSVVVGRIGTQGDLSLAAAETVADSCVRKIECLGEAADE